MPALQGTRPCFGFPITTARPIRVTRNSRYRASLPHSRGRTYAQGKLAAKSQFAVRLGTLKFRDSSRSEVPSPRPRCPTRTSSRASNRKVPICGSVSTSPPAPPPGLSIGSSRLPAIRIACRSRSAPGRREDARRRKPIHFHSRSGQSDHVSPQTALPKQSLLRQLRMTLPPLGEW